MISVKFLKAINKLFPLPKHPFNMESNGEMTYSMWQFEKGKETIKFYLEYTTTDDMFKDKNVLDVGCGAAGKSLYYLSLGAASVTGIDLVEKYENEAYKLAEKLNLKGFKYVLTDAANTPFENNSFDTIIMNDAMEHVAKPLDVLNEVYRILKPGGRLFVNFPPYNHPFGAHLSDAIGIPWVHVFFSDKTLIEGYKELVKDIDGGQDRINFRISKDENGREYFSYINKMTIKWFKDICKNTKFNQRYYKEVPLRSFLKPLTKINFLKDFTVKMAVCILEKEC